MAIDTGNMRAWQSAPSTAPAPNPGIGQRLLMVLMILEECEVIAEGLARSCCIGRPTDGAGGEQKGPPQNLPMQALPMQALDLVNAAQRLRDRLQDISNAL